MPSFWVEAADVAGERLTLRGAEAHHLLRVRRLRRGDRIEVVDGLGLSFVATVAEVDVDRVECRVEQRRAEWGESPARLCLVAAVVQGHRFDQVIEKATEIGVDSIRPLLCERTAVHAATGQKVPRWQRLARAAVKQCGRSRMPLVHPPASLAQTVAALAGDHVLLMASPDAPVQPLSRLLAPARGRRLALLVGPGRGVHARRTRQRRGRRRRGVFVEHTRAQSRDGLPGAGGSRPPRGGAGRLAGGVNGAGGGDGGLSDPGAART